MKRALITGITGQDGFYLAKFLLNKGYEVYGLYRRVSKHISERIDEEIKKVHLVEGDVTDPSSIIRVLQEVRPDEVYNLAAQSFVPSSWTQPISSTEIIGLGALNILESIRLVDKKIKYYQASTSEMFGKVVKTPQTEETPFHPRSPYGVAKVYAYWITRNYRESYGIFTCNGILFNHESPKRGKEFVTRKISHAAARIKLGIQEFLEIGNMDAKRDWGYAGDYVEAMWLMLQQEVPDDFLIATGENHSIREFLEESFKTLGMEITWQGEGLNEVGIANGRIVVRINPEYYRPAEVDLLLGDYTKARESLGWKPKTKFQELVKMMVEEDVKELQKNVKK